MSSATPSSSAARPPFLSALLASGPHPALTLAHTMAHGGHSPQLASQIVDARMDPRVEAACHLANGDLYSAHFLVRKMQNDGQWLHAILHRYESDYSNTKAWLRDCQEEMLAGFPGFGHTRAGSASPASKDRAHHAAYLLTDRIAMLCKSHPPQKLVEQYTEREIPSPPAPTLAELQAIADRHTPASSDRDRAAVEREAWDELVYLVEHLGERFGWAQGVEGTHAYTAQTEKQKEMIRKMQGGGEGIRKF